jgi:hypothetical protein
MKYSDVNFQPRGLDPDQAAYYVGSAQLLQEYIDAGWIEPFVRRHRLTRYDRMDLDQCIEQQKLQQRETTRACR